MNFGVAWHLLWATVILPVHANPGEEFLHTIIDQLKQQRPSHNKLLQDELFRASSRSSDQYEIHETPETLDNSLYPQVNNEFHYNQNQQEQLLQQQFNQIQNQASIAPGNEINPQLVNLPLDQLHPTPQIIGLQQFNVNGYLNLPLELQPAPELFSESTTIPQTNLYENGGSGFFNPADENHLKLAYGILGINDQQQLPNAQNNHQLLLPNDQQQVLSQDLQNNELTHTGTENQLIPTYYFYNPNNANDENLLENTIDAIRPLSVNTDKKIFVEPLFVAMAGFVGIAIIFMSAVLFLPKVFTPAPEVSSLKGPQELAAFTKLAVEAIEGNDCTERIACEVGRAMRSLQVDTKPIKVLEVLLPADLAKQLVKIRRAVVNKQTCKLIRCKPLNTEKKQSKTNSDVEAKIAIKSQTKLNRPTASELLEPKTKLQNKQPTTQKPGISNKPPKLTEKNQVRTTEKTTTVNS